MQSEEKSSLLWVASQYFQALPSSWSNSSRPDHQCLSEGYKFRVLRSAKNPALAVDK